MRSFSVQSCYDGGSKSCSKCNDLKLQQILRAGLHDSTRKTQKKLTDDGHVVIFVAACPLYDKLIAWFSKQIFLTKRCQIFYSSEQRRNGKCQQHNTTLPAEQL
jgi:Tol biopolymer transport system component